jgi:hypothetical protein
MRSGRATPIATPANAPAVYMPSVLVLVLVFDSGDAEGVEDARADPTSCAIWFGRSTMLASSEIVKVFESLWQSVVLAPHAKVLLSPPLVHGVIAISVDESTIFSQHYCKIYMKEIGISPS